MKTILGLGPQKIKSSSRKKSREKLNKQKEKSQTNIASKESLFYETKKKNVEDTFTFLDKLERMNKMQEIQKLNFD